MSDVEVKKGDPTEVEKLENKDSAPDISHERFGMREVVIPIGSGELRFNPLTSIFAIILLWGISIWCMMEPIASRDKLLEFRATVADMFTWFYVGTNPAFMFFILWVAWRYGDLRLGHKDSKPEFDDITYFAMLFSAGIGVGLFFYGVSEPLWHRGSNWYASGDHAQDDVDMFAMNITVFHWGVTGWSQYLVIALCAGLASFRFDLPLTLRSCFFPILGDYTWGWIGDFIDGYTIVTTVAGVCTSLGLGAFQIAAGLKRVGAIDPQITEDDETNVHLYSIWFITGLATISVVSGLGVGIKYLSQIGFGLGMLLLVWVFCLEKTNYLLNLIVQEIGYYIQYSVLQLNFHTDAFGQLQTGEGRAVDGNAAATWFMDAWTIFYIGWWVSWAGFVGLFVARISKGRTIRSIVVFGYVCPLLYSIIWFGVFGGVGFRQARQATEIQELGLSLHNNSDYYQNSEQAVCYDVPQVAEIPYTGPDGSAKTFTNTLMGITPVCVLNTADDQTAWFNVLNSFTYPDDFDIGFGPFLTWVSIFSVSVYFVTSSDSGSLIVDHLASNGFEEAHWLQRVFWAFTEGAVATALLVSGGQDALKGLQAASILSGLPFTFFLIFMCHTIVTMCKVAEENENTGKLITLEENYKSSKTFKMPVFGGIFNYCEKALSCGYVPELRHDIAQTNSGEVSGFFIAILCPFIPLYGILNLARPKAPQATGNKILALLHGFFYYLFIALFACISKGKGFRAFGFSAMLICGGILCWTRTTIREMNNIAGNTVSDYISSTLFWPQVVVQLQKELQADQDEGLQEGEREHNMEKVDKHTA